MDDDAPLSALAKAPKFDDDTPLASLADGKKLAKPGDKASKSGAKPGVKPLGVIKPGFAKQPGTKPKRKASSSSSSGSSSSSSSSSDKKPQKGKKGLKKGVSKEGAEGEEEEFDGGGAVKSKTRSQKEQVAAELLCRWWYVLPDWPPVDLDYTKLLAEKGLRPVTVDEWEWVPEEVNGRKKVYPLKQFRGLYRSSAGDLIDVRPKDTCPCQVVFMKKELPDLYGLLVKAYEAQIVALQQSKHDERKLEGIINNRLTTLRKQSHQANQVSALKRSK